MGKVATTTVMGLDDFLLSNGSLCPAVSKNDCDFEVNLCYWAQVNSGGELHEWKWNQQATQYRDHSTGTVNGHYLAVTSPTATGLLPAIQFKMSTLIRFRRPFFLRRPFCLKLYYYWDTSLSANLTDTWSHFSVTIKDRGNGLQSQDFSLVDGFNAGFLKEWNMATVNFRASPFAVVAVSANITQSGTVLMIDDLSIDSGFCPVGGSCDFEHGNKALFNDNQTFFHKLFFALDMCGWENAATSSGRKRVLWLRIQPNSLFLKGTFLKFDSTTHSPNGNYLVLPNQMIDHATSVLKSPLLHRSSVSGGKICFSLRYFARAYSTNGSVPAFTVRFVDLTRRRNSAEVVNATQTMVDWSLYRREFSNLPATFRFYIETTYLGPTKELLSDVGIDDIQVQSGACSGGNNNNQPSSTTPLPADEKMFDCTFDESAACNWQYNNSVWNVTDFRDRKW